MSVDSQIALAFLRRYPTPLDAHGLGQQRLQAFLKRHGYTGRKPARELLARLRNGAEGRAGELETQARRQIVLALVSALEPIVARISELTIEIRHALDQHPDGQTFRSLFIAPDSWLCAATMLSEIGDCRDRYPSYRALAADAANAPLPSSPAKPNTHSSAGLVTTDYGQRSAPSLTQAAATTHGRPTSMTAPAPEAPVTPTPPASSDAPGAKSSGAYGTTTTPTTHSDTPPYNASSQPEVDTGGLIARASARRGSTTGRAGVSPGSRNRFVYREFVISGARGTPTPDLLGAIPARLTERVEQVWWGVLWAVPRALGWQMRGSAGRRLRVGLWRVGSARWW